MAEITLNGLYVYGSFEGGSTMYISEIKAGGDETIVNKIAPEYLETSPEPLRVVFTLGDNGYEASHTFAEIEAAYKAGRQIIGCTKAEEHGYNLFESSNVIVVADTQE